MDREGDRPTVEADIELAAVAWAKANGVFCRKVQWIGRRNAPDRLFGVRAGVFVEFKKPGKPLRIGQYKEKQRMCAAGIEAHGPVDSFAQFLKIMEGQNGRRRV